jgi:hypothetical protein
MSHNSKPLNPQQLRQRRARIIRETAEDERERKELERVMMMGANTQAGYSLKTSIVILTAVIVTAGCAIQYHNGDYFRRLMKRMNNRSEYPIFQFATRFPPGVVLERDLPRFFRSYSIATPENEAARNAVRKVSRSRFQLKRRAGVIRTVLNGWDEKMVGNLLTRGWCGADFDGAYQRGSQERRDDLLMWCLLATRIAEGYFMESVEMIDTALFLTRKRGMVVRRRKESTPPRSGSGGGDDDNNNNNKYNNHDALSNVYYLHPRTNNTKVDWIPTKTLAWMFSNPEDVLLGGDGSSSPADARDLLQRYLGELVFADGNEDEFLVLEEVCQNSRPSRAIAVNCPDGEEDGAGGGCCYFVLPERYGGNLEPEAEEAEEE